MSIASIDRADWVKPNPLADPRSLESRFRARRFAHIKGLIDDALQARDRVDIVDLGGTEQYWQIAADYLNQHRGRLSITLVNNEPTVPPSDPLFASVEGDACDPDLFGGRRFDVVHSNSVIEHVGDWSRMQAFADNVVRLSERYFVQTPNYWFPLEPHFRVVGFQWLPLPARAALMRRFNLGFFPRAKTPEEAWDNVREIRLLDRRMMMALFPQAELRIEKVAGFAKSVMVVGRAST